MRVLNLFDIRTNPCNLGLSNVTWSLAANSKHQTSSNRLCVYSCRHDLIRITWIQNSSQTPEPPITNVLKDGLKYRYSGYTYIGKYLNCRLDMILSSPK